MQYDSYFVIRATPALQVLLERSALGATVEPVLWTAKAGGRTVWSDGDVITAVKCAYIMRLQSEFDSNLPIEIRSLEATAQAFDNYWELEYFMSVDAHLEDVVAEISSARGLAQVGVSQSKYLDAIARTVVVAGDGQEQ
jgi:hypothetical protein